MTAAGCLQPTPLVKLSDYEGPFAKTVGLFARRIDNTSVRVPRYVPGRTLCSLSPSGKFRFWIRDSADPLAIAGSLFDASIDMWNDGNTVLAHGAKGYAERAGIQYVAGTTSRFVTDFVLPSAFHEDPRYYRLGHGPAGRRLFHAMAHVFVAHNDSGRHQPNYSELLGTPINTIMNGAWWPGGNLNHTTFQQGVWQSVAYDMGFDIVREFWPEVARGLRLPFRDSRQHAQLDR